MYTINVSSTQLLFPFTTKLLIIPFKNNNLTIFNHLTENKYIFSHNTTYHRRDHSTGNHNSLS